MKESPPQAATTKPKLSDSDQVEFQRHWKKGLTTSTPSGPAHPLTWASAEAARNPSASLRGTPRAWGGGRGGNGSSTEPDAACEALPVPTPFSPAARGRRPGPDPGRSHRHPRGRRRRGGVPTEAGRHCACVRQQRHTPASPAPRGAPLKPCPGIRRRPALFPPPWAAEGARTLNLKITLLP